MPRFEFDVPIETDTPTVQVDPLPTPGDFKFELVVTDEEGNESAPATVVVSVKESRPRPGFGTVTGTVVDRMTRKPMPGVAIAVLNTLLQAVTSAEGTFILKNVPAGAQTLVAAGDRRRTELVVDVVAEEAIRVTIFL